MPALLQDVGIDHGCGQIIMSQQGLNRADVGTALEQVGGKGMAKRMSADTLGQTHAADGFYNPQPAAVQKLRNQLGSSLFPSTAR